jgi:hypothetical protein
MSSPHFDIDSRWKRIWIVKWERTVRYTSDLGVIKSIPGYMNAKNATEWAIALIYLPMLFIISSQQHIVVMEI